MKYKVLYEIDQIGEESGREEAAEDFPNLPQLHTFSGDEIARYRRMLSRYGRGRAQGLYQLRGKKARVFAWSWAFGYLANCEMFEEEQS